MEYSECDKERFYAKVNVTDDCHMWTASANSNGYGAFSVRGTPRGAHRVAYELVYGPIPDGLVIDHRCHTRGCVNVAHLEAVDLAENSRRSVLDNYALHEKTWSMQRKATAAKRKPQFAELIETGGPSVALLDTRLAEWAVASGLTTYPTARARRVVTATKDLVLDYWPSYPYVILYRPAISTVDTDAVLTAIEAFASKGFGVQRLHVPAKVFLERWDQWVESLGGRYVQMWSRLPSGLDGSLAA